MSLKRSHYYHLKGSTPIPEGWDGIRVGSETCTRLLPTSRDIRRISEEMDAGVLSLVTPVAGPDEVNDVLNIILTSAGLRWNEVVVNDWGILDAAGGLEGIQITAGRLLMRFRRGPGAFDPWDELDLSSRRYLAWGPLYDSPFLALLKKKGVSRIELDLPRHWFPLPDLNGFRFSLHRGTRLISVSAACPWLYDTEKRAWNPTAGCDRTCTGHSDMVMTSPAVDGSLLLRGRAVLERVEVDTGELKLPDNVDRIIFDPVS